MARFVVTDPRDPDREAELPVHFKIASFGQDPSGYAEHFDPGAGPEIDLTFALDVCNVDVLPFMAPHQLEDIEDQIRDGFDFHAAKRDERESEYAMEAAEARA